MQKSLATPSFLYLLLGKCGKRCSNSLKHLQTWMQIHPSMRRFAFAIFYPSNLSLANWKKAWRTVALKITRRSDSLETKHKEITGGWRHLHITVREPPKPFRAALSQPLMVKGVLASWPTGHPHLHWLPRGFSRWGFGFWRANIWDLTGKDTTGRSAQGWCWQ